MANLAIGVDIGGSGIKAAPVDLDTGTLAVPRLRHATPQPATPKAVAAVVGSMLKEKQFQGIEIAGFGFPAAIKKGHPMTAANVDKSWIGTDAAGLLGKTIGREIHMLNDADAAGIAETRFGAGKGVSGEVMMVTLGTGIGTGYFVDGRLVPNTELGHIELDGRDAETWAAASVRERKKLGWKEWALRVDAYLNALDRLLWLDLIIIGGGVSSSPDRFLPHLKTRCPVVVATMGNDAGIVGAAIYAAEHASALPRS